MKSDTQLWNEALNELKALAEKGELDQAILDDLVNEEKRLEAFALNNADQLSQIIYLIESRTRSEMLNLFLWS